MKNRFNSELGQAIMEFALVIPIFVLLVMFILDCAWVGFQRISFDYACREASWGSGLSSYACSSDGIYTDYGPQVDKSISDRVLEQAPQLNKKNLKVEDAQCYYWTRRVTVNTPDAYGRTLQDFENQRYVQISGLVSYKIKMLTPIGGGIFGNNIEMVKQIYKTRLIRSNYA